VYDDIIRTPEKTQGHRLCAPNNMD